MGLIAIIGIGVLLAVILLPQVWVRNAIAKHSQERPEFPGTGGELVEHLAREMQLSELKLEQSDHGDHYDPDDKTVRLSPQHLNGKSVAAVAIAAHEFSHALQDAQGDRMLSLRQTLAKVALFSDKVASAFFLAAPFLAILARTPAAFFALVGFGIALLAIRIIVHLITLPVEYDASFKKALPILEQGGYLAPSDMPAAREVLRAAALTYVAGALMSLLDLARWIRILR